MEHGHCSSFRCDLLRSARDIYDQQYCVIIILGRDICLHWDYVGSFNLFQTPTRNQKISTWVRPRGAKRSQLIHLSFTRICHEMSSFAQNIWYIQPHILMLNINSLHLAVCIYILFSGMRYYYLLYRKMIIWILWIKLKCLILLPQAWMKDFKGRLPIISSPQPSPEGPGRRTRSPYGSTGVTLIFPFTGECSWHFCHLDIRNSSF